MRRVLIAEDDPALRLLYRLWLEGEGHFVAEAADGREALALLEGAPLPDAAVLDVNMPYVDGLSVCRYLRLRAPAIPIVIVSGMQAVAPEATAVLAKPCTREELLSALETTRPVTALRSHAARRAERAPASRSDAPARA